MTAERLPDGAMHGPDFNITKIPRSTHLFFDDQCNNIWDVQTASKNDGGWNIQSTWCSPTHVELYDDTGKMTSFDCVHQKDDYISLKMNDASFTQKFKQVLQSIPLLPEFIGTGITPTIIRQIIENEPPQNKRTGLYFFDFDMLLNQFNGLKFLESIEPTEDLEQYAKYLFSDHIGVEPLKKGRLNLLKEMFESIGPGRAYIITANPYAGNLYTNDKGRVLNPNPHLVVFIRLLQVLLPSFMPDHLVCSAGRKKSDKIRDILDNLNAKGGSKARSRANARSRSKARSNARSRSKARSKARSRSSAIKHKSKCI
jgi:hypothetical protein